MSRMKLLDGAMRKLYNFRQLGDKELSVTWGYFQARFDMNKFPLPAAFALQEQEVVLSHTSCEKRILNVLKKRKRVQCSVHRGVPRRSPEDRD
jgi:hypothetical protein